MRTCHMPSNPSKARPCCHALPCLGPSFPCPGPCRAQAGHVPLPDLAGCNHDRERDREREKERERDREKEREKERERERERAKERAPERSRERDRERERDVVGTPREKERERDRTRDAR